MKNKLLFSVMLVCVTLFVYQGATLAGITGKIAGIITDASTGEPMPAVNVVIEGTTLGGATDNEGHFFIINIPPGTYSLQASMIGYTVESKTGIIVNVDHTTPVDFDLRVTAIAGEEITVTAEREIVPMDISASHIVADAEQILEVPMITDIAQYIHLQAGIAGNYIRGGGLDETGFMMDGLTVVDNRTNQPLMMVNLSAVRELNIIKGGFNPEYGNVRSGLINVITKEGSPGVYHGSIDFRISPPRLKHSDVSIFNPENYHLKPYLDEDVCWVGTTDATEWDGLTGDDLTYMKNQYPDFTGWNLYSQLRMDDEDPANDITAQQARDRYMWLHRVEGSSALLPVGQKEQQYGHKPDWNMDVSLGGPVPYIGKYLGNLSFFLSHRTNWEMFALPISRDYFKQNNTNIKLTSRLSQSMKLTIEGLYGVTNTTQSNNQSFGYFSSGQAALNRAGHVNMYYPESYGGFEIFQSMVGLSFDHVLSPRTFYNIRISNIKTQNHLSPHYPMSFKTAKDSQGNYIDSEGNIIPESHNMRLRDAMYHPETGELIEDNVVRYFGNAPMDEAPYGAIIAGGPMLMDDGFYYGAHSAGGRNLSGTRTFNVKFDITSQVDRYNQIKAGFMFNYDDLINHQEFIRWESTWSSKEEIWRQYPIRYGGYIQDKLEFEGMIANFGLRLDVNDPNCEWWDLEKYDRYFTIAKKEAFYTEAPRKKVKGHLLIQPRLGVSHPISEEAKLYFNYGHFYSMPRSYTMYEIDQSSASRGIRGIGNPEAKIPITISYELGVEYNVRDLFLIHLAGYYKDIGDETGSVSYQSYDGLVSYNTYENREYSDIRGFELRIDKRFGRWITGWLNYNYMVTTSGEIGRDTNFEDPRDQRIFGWTNPIQSRPLARPRARANINIRSPRDFGPGPVIGGVKILGDIHLSTLCSWRAGSYFTWDPEGTDELYRNQQWKPSYNVDQRISKRLRFGKYSVQIFADIKNLFDIKRIDSDGFSSDMDRDLYYTSLHLAQYNDEEIYGGDYTGGKDRVGDIGGPGTDKSYIDMPDIKYLTYQNRRYVQFGLRIDF